MAQKLIVIKYNGANRLDKKLMDLNFMKPNFVLDVMAIV